MTAVADTHQDGFAGVFGAGRTGGSRSAMPDAAGFVAPGVVGLRLFLSELSAAEDINVVRGLLAVQYDTHAYRGEDFDNLDFAGVRVEEDALIEAVREHLRRCADLLARNPCVRDGQAIFRPCGLLNLPASARENVAGLAAGLGLSDPTVAKANWRASR